MFILGGHEESVTLKSYTATTSGTKSVLTLKVEISDHSHLGWTLRELEDVLTAQKAREAARKAAARKPAKTEPKPLALPAPQRRLPSPGDL